MLGGFKLVVREARALGPGFLRHYSARARGRGEITLPLKNAGQVTVRPADSDVEVLRQVFLDREYSFSLYPPWQRVTAAYQELVAQGRTPIIVDAGANIGAASIHFRREFPKAAIVAVEPDPGNADLLRRNVEPHGVTVLEAALGSAPGHVSVSKSKNSWGIRTQRADQGCPVVTMADAFAAAEGVPWLAKIDIEGFESDVFSRNLDWLDAVYAVILEPHDWLLPGSSESFQRAFGERQFDMMMKGENLLYSRRL